MLRNLIDLRDCLVDLIDAFALLVRGGFDLGHDARHAADRIHRFLHRPARLGDQRRALLHLRGRIADQLLDFLRRRARTLREVAHFRCDDRETAPLLTGAGRFDRRVQRQNVGLERDAFDHADDLGHLARRIGDAVHRLRHARDDLAAAHDRLQRALCETACLLRVIRVLFHRCRQFLHARGRLLKRRGLLLGAARQIRVARRDLVCAQRDRFGAAAHFRYGIDEAVAHLRQRGQQLAHFIA